MTDVCRVPSQDEGAGHFPQAAVWGTCPITDETIANDTQGTKPRSVASGGELDTGLY